MDKFPVIAAAPGTPIALLLDLGNTRLKLGYWHAGLHGAVFLQAHPHKELAQLQSWLAQMLELFEQHPLQAFGVSVASQATMDAIASCLAQQNNPVRLQWLWPQHEVHGVTNAYPQPAQLGADRWASMLGLQSRFGRTPRSVILANFGTATTVDTLSRDKVFLGGLILPGVTMMQTSLSQGTARLPLAQGEVCDYPTDTHAAITTGIVAAQLGAIRRQKELSEKRDGQAPVMCVSGGAWHLLEREWHRLLPDTDVQELAHVVLDGLALHAQVDLKSAPDHPVV